MSSATGDLPFVVRYPSIPQDRLATNGRGADSILIIRSPEVSKPVLSVSKGVRAPCETPRPRFRESIDVISRVQEMKSNKNKTYGRGNVAQGEDGSLHVHLNITRDFYEDRTDDQQGSIVMEIHLVSQ